MRRRWNLAVVAAFLCSCNVYKFSAWQVEAFSLSSARHDFQKELLHYQKHFTVLSDAIAEIAVDTIAETDKVDLEQQEQHQLHPATKSSLTVNRMPALSEDDLIFERQDQQKEQHKTFLVQDTPQQQPSLLSNSSFDSEESKRLSKWQWERKMKRKQIQQQKGRKVVASYQLEDQFDPIPWTRNCHVQTILGFFFRDSIAAFVPRNDSLGASSRIVRGLWEKVVSKPRSDEKDDKKINILGVTTKEEEVEGASRNENENLWDVRRRIATPDGDWFHADIKFPRGRRKSSISDGTSDDSFFTKNSVVEKHIILVHGLESNSNSSLSQQISRACWQNDENNTMVTCLNFRSCSMDGEGEFLLNELPGAYHLGFTDDLKYFLELNRKELLRERRKQEIYLTGFSLGSNVVLKALGELGPSAQSLYNIQGAAVGCAPFEQETNAKALARPGINRIIYTNKLLDSLKAKAFETWNRFGDHKNPADIAAIEKYKLQQQERDWTYQINKKFLLLGTHVDSVVDSILYGGAVHGNEMKNLSNNDVERSSSHHNDKTMAFVSSGLMMGLLTQLLLWESKAFAYSSTDFTLLIAALSSYLSVGDTKGKGGVGDFVRSIGKVGEDSLLVLNHAWHETLTSHPSYRDRIQGSWNNLVDHIRSNGASYQHEQTRQSTSAEESAHLHSVDGLVTDFSSLPFWLEQAKDLQLLHNGMKIDGDQFRGTTYLPDSLHAAAELKRGLAGETILASSLAAIVFASTVINAYGGDNQLEILMAVGLTAAYSVIHQGPVGSVLQLLGDAIVGMFLFSLHVWEYSRRITVASWSEDVATPALTKSFPRLEIAAETSDETQVFAHVTLKEADFSFQQKQENWPSRPDYNFRSTGDHKKKQFALISPLFARHEGSLSYDTAKDVPRPSILLDRVRYSFLSRSMIAWVVLTLFEMLEATRNSKPSTNVVKPHFDLPRALAAETITEFDDAFIASIYGFRNCWDYYRQTSSIYYMDDITVPTLVINALDDPFFDSSVFPIDKTVDGGGCSPIKLFRADYGGHLGFCFHQTNNSSEMTKCNSWLPLQLAKFLRHVEKSRT